MLEEGLLLKKVVIATVLLVCGCTSLQIPDNFSYKEISAGDFKLASWQKITNGQAPVKIYIEGDGHSFDVYGQPTNNPTPKGTLLRKIAFNDDNPNVVYLARPCQFVKDDKCIQKYWTTARFSPEVIQAEASAVRKIAKGRSVILIGFSGGAQIAGLIAVLNTDISVKKLVTIGGNLDHKAWTAYHDLPYLRDSLNLASYRDKYLQIPQVHFIGAKDEIIPPALVKKFAHAEDIKEVKKAQHNKGWESIYPLIWAEQ